jgi:hypothetical protein
MCPDSNQIKYLDDINYYSKIGWDSMKAKLLVIWSLIIVLAAYTSALSDPDKKQDAQKASDAWLMLLDTGAYDDCWQSASPFLKGSISQKKLKKALYSVRKPLGKVVARRIESQEYTTKLPDVPIGEYVIIIYKTAFENNKSVNETVVSNLDKNGTWRVSGYFAK